MKERAKTGVLIVLVTLFALLCKFLPHTIGDYIFDIFILVIVIVAGFEMAGMMEKTGRTVNKFLATMYGVFNYVATLIAVSLGVKFTLILLVQVVALLAYFAVLIVVEMVMAKNTDIKVHAVTALNTILTCIYPTFLFGMMLIINHADAYAGIRNFSFVFILLVFVITTLTDTFAYLVGCKLRGPKLAPSISPNKTISGAIGGLFGGMIGAMLVFALVYNVPNMATILSMYGLRWWHFLLIGLFGSVVGQAGDLFESKMKRNASVKDSGNIFPGHGGMLDRYDAMTFVSAFIFIVVSIILW